MVDSVSPAPAVTVLAYLLALAEPVAAGATEKQSMLQVQVQSTPLEIVLSGFLPRVSVAAAATVDSASPVAAGALVAAD